MSYTKYKIFFSFLVFGITSNFLSAKDSTNYSHSIVVIGNLKIQLEKSNILIREWMFTQSDTNISNKQELIHLNRKLIPSTLDSVSIISKKWKFHEKEKFELLRVKIDSLLKLHKKVMDAYNNFDSYEDVTVYEYTQNLLKPYSELHELNRGVLKQSYELSELIQNSFHANEKEKLISKQRQQQEKEMKQRRNNLQFSIIFLALLALSILVASLGFINISPKLADGLIFFAFLILFEFLLVLADPLVDTWADGAPGYKLLINSFMAVIIFPAHSFFERTLKKRLLDNKRKK